MIQKYVDKFINSRPLVRSSLRDFFREQYGQPGYDDLVKLVIETIADPVGYDEPDPTRITCIDHGVYQGTQLYIIAAQNYQPSRFWYTLVSYGSCSGCDTLKSILPWDNDEVDDKVIDDLYILCLHIVQKLKPLEEEMP